MELHRLRHTSDQPSCTQIAAFVAKLAADAGLNPQRAYRLRLAADEVVANIVEHGYRGEPRAIDLSVGTSADGVWMRIEDDAPPFDPTKYVPAEPLNGDLSTAPIGGHGLRLAQDALDGWEYEYVDGRNRNLLCIRTA